MAKYDMTPELAYAIKAARIQNHVTSKSVAEHIGKSQSYMSKLEKGDIKSINESELTTIFQFIFGNSPDYQEFLNSTLKAILSSLELRFSDEEIDKQIWFYNYDTVRRLIPIPEPLVDDLKAKLDMLGISVETLCNRINSNEDISPEVTNTDQYPFNEWHAFVVDHQIKFSFIKMSVSPSDIEEVLNKERRSINYITLLSLVYYLLKFEKAASSGDNKNIMAEAHDYLNRFKFFSITEKRKLDRLAQTEAERNSLLSAFDKENAKLLIEILAAFQVFSELDIAKTNEYLKTFVDNLKWDNGFMMRLISTPFHELTNASFSAKKLLLSQIQSDVVELQSLPENQKKLEIYD